MRAVDFLCLVYVIANVLVLTAVGLFDDNLFFHSDFASILVIDTVVSAALFAGLVVLAAPALAASRGVRRRANEVAALALAALIVGNFGFFFFDVLDREFRIFGLFRKLDAEFLFFVLWLVIVGLSGFGLVRHGDRRGIVDRVLLLARVAAPLGLVAFAALLGNAKLQAASTGDTGEPKQVVMIVLDGWPAQYLRAFNPAASPKPVDALLADALVLSNMRTSTAWTNAYFGTLYSGTPRLAFADVKARLRDQLRGDVALSGRNLLSVLQALGVNTRWMVGHRNAVPEASAAAVTSYNGFRSVFLTPRHAWLFDAVGLSYNLILPVSSNRSIKAGQRRSLLFDLLNPREKPDNVLTAYLLPEMRRMQRRHPRSFILFHVDWKIGSAKLPAAWDESAADRSPKKVAKKIRQRDYRYRADQEWYAAWTREKTDRTMAVVGDKIAAFHARLVEEGLLDGTLLILTADHGSIFSKGRFWYGYHPSEEVLRVPFVVINGGRSGTDDRMFDTVDIPHSIIALFGDAAPLDDRAVSIFGDATKPVSASMTLRSNKNAEWYLAIYKVDEKFLFNLHPEGDGASQRLSVEDFDTAVVESGDGVVASVESELRRAFTEFGLVGQPVHAEFARFAAPGENR